MLKDQEVCEELERLNAELAVELAARRQRLLDRLEAIVFADPTPLINFALGAPQSLGAKSDIADLPADLLALLDVRVSVSTRGRRFTLNLPNRLRALTLLAKLLGLTTPAKPVTIEEEPEPRRESHGLHGAGGPLMKTCECWYCREAREEAGIPHPRELCWEQRNANTFFTTQKDSADNQNQPYKSRHADGNSTVWKPAPAALCDQTPNQESPCNNETQPYNSRHEEVGYLLGDSSSTVWKPTPVAPANQTPTQPITSPIPNPIPQSPNPSNRGSDNSNQADNSRNAVVGDLHVESDSTVWKPATAALRDQTPAPDSSSTQPNLILQSQNPINRGSDTPTKNSALKTQNYAHPYLRTLPAPWEGVHYPDIDIPSDVPIHTWLSRRGFLPYEPDLEDDLEIDPNILRPARWD